MTRTRLTCLILLMLLIAVLTLGAWQQAKPSLVSMTPTQSQFYCPKSFHIKGRGIDGQRKDFVTKIRRPLKETPKFDPSAQEVEDQQYYRGQYQIIGPPTTRQNCAGYVMNKLWPTGNPDTGNLDTSNLYYEAGDFYREIIQNFGKEDTGQVQKGDVVVFFTGGVAKHVAYVSSQAARTDNVEIESKDNQESLMGGLLDRNRGAFNSPKDPIIDKNGPYKIYHIDRNEVSVTEVAAGQCDADVAPDLKVVIAVNENAYGDLRPIQKAIVTLRLQTGETLNPTEIDTTKGEYVFPISDIPSGRLSTARLGLSVEVKMDGYKPASDKISAEFLSDTERLWNITMSRTAENPIEADPNIPIPPAQELKLQELRKKSLELETRIAALEELKITVAKKFESARQNGLRVEQAETKTKELIGQLKALQTVVDEIEKLCNDASAKKNEIQAKVAEAERLGNLVRDTLDDASKLAANCTTKEIASQIKAKFQDSVQAAARIEILKREAAALNRIFPGLALQLAQALARLSVGQLYVQQNKDEIREADKNFAAATKEITEIGPIQTKVVNGALEISLQISRFKEFYPRGTDGEIPPDVAKRIQTLEARAVALTKVSPDESSSIKNLAETYNHVQQTRDEADALAERYLKAVCTIMSMDTEVGQIDAVATSAALAAHSVSDLPQKAAQCEARADCLPKIIPINDLLAIGDSEKAEPMINKLKAQGCDTKEIEDEYWRVQARVQPLLARALAAYGNISTTCDYVAARIAAEELQAAFPQHPWIVQNLRDIQKGATAQIEVTDLLKKAKAEGVLTVRHVDINPLYLPKGQGNPADVDAAIAQAAQIAAPYPCMTTSVQNFKTAFEKNRSLAGRIGSVKARINELATKKASAQKNAQQAASFADQAAQLLAQVYGYDDQISGIADKCRLAAAVRASVESASRDAIAQEKALRSDLDDAIAKAANCANKRDAADVQTKYDNAIRTAGQVGVAAKAARQANQEELQSLLSDINNGKGAYQKANDLADRLAEAVGKVSLALNASRADVQSGEALKANFSNVGVGLRAEIDKLRADNQPDRIAPSLNDEISALYSLLDSAIVDSNNISFDGIVSGAEAQASRANDLAVSAQAKMQKYQKAAVCNVTTADDLVDQMDGVVTGMTVELGAASDAARRANDCLKNSQPLAGDKPLEPGKPQGEVISDPATKAGSGPVGYPINTNKPKVEPPTVEEIPATNRNKPKVEPPKVEEIPDSVTYVNKPKSDPPKVEEIPDSVIYANKPKSDPSKVEEIPDSVTYRNKPKSDPPKVEEIPDSVTNTKKPKSDPPKVSPPAVAAPAQTRPRPSPFDLSGDWSVVWNWSVTTVTFVGKITGEGSQWVFRGTVESGGNAIWRPAKGSGNIACALSGRPGSPGKMSCNAAFTDGNWQAEADGTIQLVSIGDKQQFEFRGKGKGTVNGGQPAGIDHLDLKPKY